uniref:Uncharacterized protein n=1 Tax=Arundo donax TaxID=35708 RepID=A0A0A9G7H4_ARUDO
MARASSSSGSSPHRADANISPAAAALISSLHSLGFSSWAACSMRILQ